MAYERNFDRRQFVNGWPNDDRVKLVRPNKKTVAELFYQVGRVTEPTSTETADNKKSLPQGPTKEVMKELVELERLFNNEKCSTIQEFLLILKGMAEKDLVIVSSVKEAKEAIPQGTQETGEMPIVVAGLDSDTARESGAKITSVQQIYKQWNRVWETINGLDQQTKKDFFTKGRIEALLAGFKIHIHEETGAELSELLYPNEKRTRNALKMRFFGLLIKHIKAEPDAIARTPGLYFTTRIRVTPSK